MDEAIAGLGGPPKVGKAADRTVDEAIAGLGGPPKVGKAADRTVDEAIAGVRWQWAPAGNAIAPWTVQAHRPRADPKLP